MSNAFEYRAAKKKEMKAVLACVNYAFAEDVDDVFGLKPEWSICAFDGSRVAATSGAFPFRSQFNGQVVDNAAVTIVTTEPEYRRRGLVRELMTRTLLKAKEDGQPIASLWASMGALYQRYGYGMACHFNSYSLDPRFGAFREPMELTGTTRRMDQDEAFTIIKPLLTKCQEGKTLDNIRDDYYWSAAYSEKGKKDRHFVVYYNGEGTPTGYASYKQKYIQRDEAGPGLQITIPDFVWLDIEAFEGLWTYFCSHDLARELKFFFVPDDDPAEHLLLEPRMLNRKTSDGLWLRIVDVEETLKQRGYTQSGAVGITVVDDVICPWNNGSWSVSAEGNGEGGSVSGISSETGTLKLNPNTLASLVSGFATASELHRIGKIQCDDNVLLLEADRLFSTQHRPYCSLEF